MMQDGVSIVTNNQNKAELLARTFVICQVHSTGSLNNEETIAQDQDALQDENECTGTINMMFSMRELNNVWKKAGKTSPGKVGYQEAK